MGGCGSQLPQHCSLLRRLHWSSDGERHPRMTPGSCGSLSPGAPISLATRHPSDARRTGSAPNTPKTSSPSPSTAPSARLDSGPGPKPGLPASGTTPLLSPVRAPPRCQPDPKPRLPMVPDTARRPLCLPFPALNGSHGHRTGSRFSVGSRDQERNSRAHDVGGGRCERPPPPVAPAPALGTAEELRPRDERASPAG